MIGRVLAPPAFHSGPCVGVEWRDAGASNALRKQEADALVGLEYEVVQRGSEYVVQNVVVGLSYFKETC